MLTVEMQYRVTSAASVTQTGQALPPTVYQANFTLAAGECLGVMGVSGAGKTSLLAAIAGLITPCTGRICMQSAVWFDGEKQVNLPTHQRPIGMVFQEGRLFPHMTVAENLRYGMPRHPIRHHNPSARVSSATHLSQLSFEAVATVLALSPLLARSPHQLSGGERQRVALGRALLRQPQLLLMDEPLSGLDEALKQQVLPYIQRVIRDLQLPTIYVSHAQEEIASVAKTVRILENGVLGEARLLSLQQA